jgi:hypothetical protein
MKLTIDEYCQKFKMSKEMVNSKIKSKKLNSILEDSELFIIVEDELEDKKQKLPEVITPKTIMPSGQKTTVAMVLALFQKENRFLKEKIIQLEEKIDGLIDDKEQLLRQERDRIEQIYITKDEQLKNIIELINKKFEYENFESSSQMIQNFPYDNEAEVVETSGLVELKEFLKSLDLKSSDKKIIKKRFLDIYDSDIRVIKKEDKLYLNTSKYDYSDLFKL